MPADGQQDGQGDLFRGQPLFILALSDSNKSFQEDRTKILGTFLQFREAAPRASDERVKEGSDPKHCWTPLRLLELEIKQSWWLGWAAVFVMMASASLRASDETAQEGET